MGNDVIISDVLDNAKGCRIDGKAIVADVIDNAEGYGMDVKTIIENPMRSLLVADNLLAHLLEMYEMYLNGEITSDDLATGVYHAELAKLIIMTLLEHDDCIRNPNLE